MADVRTGSPGMSLDQIVRAGILSAWNGGLVDNITWVRIPAPGGFEINVAAETLSVQGLRLPASFNDEIAICLGNAILPITDTVMDARYAAANPKGVAITEDGPPAGAGELFNDPGQVIRFNATMGPVGERLREGECKAWIVRADLQPGQVINRGFRKADGSLYQVGTSISPHNADYKGYSQQFAPMAVAGFLNGKPVNMLDQFANGCALGKFPAWLVQRLRGAVA